VNDLAEMIRDYIHECFDNKNYVPSDDEGIYEVSGPSTF
jgi:hypothetical protein